MRHEIDNQPHRNNLLKTVEGTAWILCDAIHTMVENDIIPEGVHDDSTLAQYISEIYEIIAECEDDAVIEHTADKMLEFAGNNKSKLMDYIKGHMGDNPLSEAILRRS